MSRFVIQNQSHRSCKLLERKMQQEKTFFEGGNVHKEPVLILRENPCKSQTLSE